MRLIRSKFEVWLKAKPVTEIVGENRDCHSCPIALFYCETSGGCEVVISTSSRSGGTVIDRGAGERSLPRWAHRFIFFVDEYVDKKISAGRALEVLAKC